MDNFTSFSSHLEHGCKDFQRITSELNKEGKPKMRDTKIALECSKAILINVINRFK